MKLFIDSLFQAVFLGFAVWTFIFVLKPEVKYGRWYSQTVDEVAIRLIIYTGLVHLLTVVFSSFDFFSLKWDEAIIRRATGPYWLGFWIYPLTYAGVTQLLWINKVRKRITLRITLAVTLFMVVNFEKFVILVTSLHRSLIWEPEYGHLIRLAAGMLIQWWTYLGLFGCILVIALWIKPKEN